MNYNFTNELSQVFERAEAIFKELSWPGVDQQIVFLAILSTPASLAYKSLENEGKNPFKIYTGIIETAKKLEIKSSENSLVQYEKDVQELLSEANNKAKLEGKDLISSVDVLNIMRSDSSKPVSRILSGKTQKKKVETEGTTVPKILYEHGKNLNELAVRGILDPIVARDEEINRIINILERRTKNNPCLIGEPGVGKTAVIEGLAPEIVSGNVPDTLKDKIIMSIDISSIVAGCKYRGDFEARFKQIIQETIEAKNIILFIDEIHMIIGAGGEENSIDGSNMLKPYISKGQLRIIGATTLIEYKKKIEKDPALERRLQQVLILEPSVKNSIEMLAILKHKYEEFHNVSITKEAIESIALLADRYISDRFLPDKAVDLLDESCVYSKINKIERSSITNPIEKESAKEGIVVSSDVVLLIVSQWTGIPVNVLGQDEIDKLMNLEKILGEVVIGQEEAIKSIASSVIRNRAGLSDENKPIGSFLFVGPSGVGKTFLTKALAKVLFNDEEAIIRIDMSEYMEKHSVSKLIGSPPGYIGYEEGGQLTEKVRRKPYSIILFDEIEKAAPEVFNVLLQILDDGRLTDAQGRVVNFKNTLIVMTSNLGSGMNNIVNRKSSLGFASATPTATDRELLKKNTDEAIREQFRPEFINRIDDIVLFNPLNKESVIKILEITIKKFLKKTSKINISFTQKAIELLSDKGYNKEYGARPLKRTFQDMIENPLSQKLISKEIKDNDIVIVDVEDNTIVFKKE